MCRNKPAGGNIMKAILKRMKTIAVILGVGGGIRFSFAPDCLCASGESDGA